MSLEPWGKLYSKTFEGSMCGAGPVVFAVWCYAIAFMKPPNGNVKLNPITVGAILGCTPNEVEAAITFLCAPDASSDSALHNGCRLIRIAPYEYEGVNWRTYRDARQPDERREQVRRAVAAHRARAKDDDVIPPVSHGKPAVSQCKPLQKHTPEADKEKRRASRLPHPFVLPDEWAQWARKERSDLSLKRSAASFADYWHAKPGVGGTKLDWFATWRNWVRSERAATAGKKSTDDMVAI